MEIFDINLNCQVECQNCEQIFLFIIVLSESPCYRRIFVDYLIGQRVY